MLFYPILYIYPIKNISIAFIFVAEGDTLHKASHNVSEYFFFKYCKLNYSVMLRGGDRGDRGFPGTPVHQ